MKGKRHFTADEIEKLRELIRQSVKASPSAQKAISQKMRNLGFYGEDDWGIRDLQVSHLDALIKSGQIQVIAGKTSNVVKLQKRKIEPVALKERPIDTTDLNIEKILANLKQNCFDPASDHESKLATRPGNYIICLKHESTLPTVACSPAFQKFIGLKVLYTGVASGSLRTRDYRQHFKGNNAGRSTLRKSLGVLFGFKQIARDKDPSTGKTKFALQDEERLSEWMKTNLLMYFFPNAQYNDIERILIEYLKPPLNIKGNYSDCNSEFRRLLSNLRGRRD